MSVLTGFEKTRDIHGTQPIIFEQYLSLIRIFAVFYFPQVFATFIYLRTCEREKLWNSFVIKKTNRYNTSFIIKMLLFAFMQEVACFTSTIII